MRRPDAVVLTLLYATAATASYISFTGDVTADFLADDPSVFVATDPNPPLTFNGGGSGWNVVDVRFSYDELSDTAFFGINTGFCITGDADCNGNPGAAGSALAALGGVDDPRLDLGEFVVLLVSFGPDGAAEPLPSQAIVIGKPRGATAGEETLSTLRVARVTTTSLDDLRCVCWERRRFSMCSFAVLS